MDVYKRPDPLIYDQQYLMGMGLAVTWDNPDIDLFEFDPAAPGGLGAFVPSSNLEANHPYRVRVRIWNGSYDAPAVGLPVSLSYVSFGVGTTSTAIATILVDLGVKGSPHEPAFAILDWRTPAVGGHYCLQARLVWPDDANPDNNLGQENVQVAAFHSPATFSFALRNEASVPRRFLLEADGYRLPELPPCDNQPPYQAGAEPAGGKSLSRLAESQARWDRARREQGYGSFALPPNWSVSIEPNEPELRPLEERQITVSVDPNGAQVSESTPVNIHSFVLANDGVRELLGGVTVYLTNA